jgi:hypothetical protein
MDPPNDPPPNDPPNDKRAARQSPAPDRSGAHSAQTVAVHLARLFWDAAVYLGETALDLIYAARLGLLMRSRGKFPDRAGDFDAQMARLEQQRSRRWASWEILSGGRRMEIRFAATVIVVVSIFGLRAYLIRGGSSREQVAYQARTAHAPSSPSPPGAASIAAPSAAPTVNQALLDAEHFAEYRKQAASGQWIVYGVVEPVERARAKLAEAQAQLKSVKAAWLLAWNKSNASSDKVSSDNVRRESLFQQHASQEAFHEADRIIKADQAVLDADRAAYDAVNEERQTKENACQAAQTEFDRAKNPVFKPVLERGDLNQWDDFKVMSPVVIKERNRYRMWYVGCHFIGDEYTCGVGHAQSRDGLSWEKSPGPVLSIADPAVSQYLHSIAVAQVGHEYMMWYAIDATPLQGNECATLNLATSTDGLSWKADGLVLSANCQNTAHLWQSVFYDGTTVHLWYSDYDSSANGSMMHLISSDGKNWHKAGSTDIGTLGVDPRRIWVLPEHAGGYRALFAQRPNNQQETQFGILQSSDLSTWRVSNETPGLSKVWSGYEGRPQSPTALVEPSGLWIWFALDPNDGADAIALAFQKEATP